MTGSRPLIPVLAVIAVIAVLAVSGYIMNRNGAASPAAPASSTTTSATGGLSASFGSSTGSAEAPTIGQATSSASVSAAVPFPASTTADLSAWQGYTDAAHGFSIAFPPNLIQSTSASGALALAFPKNVYFHWPLLDDAKVTVSAGATCPAMTVSGGLTGQADISSFMLGDVQWNRSVGHDVGAGQRYDEVLYDTTAAGGCVSIDFQDHGTNGAGFYVDDQSLVQQYDSAHDADFAAVIDVLNGIVSSFKLVRSQP